MSSPETPHRDKRSKGGCYNCRVRKVKCTRPSQASDASGPKGPCNNCARLRFECRWSAPAPGEEYTPPPKRRRTLRKASGQAIGDASEAEGSEAPDNRDDSTRLSTFGLPTNEAGPSSMASQVPPINGTATGDFDELWNDLLDLGNMPVVSMDWNQALDIVLPYQTVNEMPELSPFSQPLLQATTNGSTVPNGFALDSTADNHLHLIRHYLEVMKGYSKVEDRDRDSNNVYLSAFSRALSLPPLYNAILAYSASHISLQDPSYSDQGHELAAQAYQGVQSISQEEQLDEPEAILSAIFILVKREHMMGGGMAQYHSLVELAAGIVERPATLETMMSDPRCFAKRIVQRLLLIDSRASLFRLPGGVFSDRMRRIDPLADVFLHHEQSSSADLLHVTLLRTKVGELDRRLHIQLREGLITKPPVHRSEITSLQREIRQALDRFHEPIADTHGSATLDVSVYNRYMVASLLHSALLYLHLIYPLPNDAPDTSVQRILEMHLAVSRDSSRKHSPSSIWPSSLFFAGVAAEDVIHQDWILGQFKMAETWGHNIKKARQLLDTIMQRRGGGSGIDIGAMMREAGEFIL